MNDSSHIFRVQQSLSMDIEKWERWRNSPGWFRDRIIAVEHYQGVNKDWEIREAVITEAAYDGTPSADFSLTLLVHAGTNQPGEYDLSAGKFYRPPISGYMNFGDGTTIQRVCGTGPLHTIQIYFPKTLLLKRVSRLLENHPSSLEVLFSRCWRDEYLERALKHMMTQCRRGNHHLDDLVDGICTRLLTLSGQKATSIHPEDRLKSKSIQQVIEHIAQYPFQHHSRDELAKIAGVQAHHFNRLFRQTTGTTPTQYIRNKRIEFAQQLLETFGTSLTINEIAKRSGFTNNSHLSRHFRDALGMTPEQYRRSK